MATTSTKIILGGKQVDPYRVSLTQRIDWHHEFEISVSSEKIEGANSISIDNSVDYIGKEAEIFIERTTGGKGVNFKGIITSIHIDRSYAFDNLIVFSGYSPTYIMEDGLGAKSFEEITLSDIANSVLGDYPGNMLNPTVSPQFSEAIPYVVRYNETNYHFLSRLAALYGEWFFYDGQALTFGKLPNPDSLDLVLGDDLDSYSYGVEIEPSTFKYQTYNALENRPVEHSSAGFSPSWLDNYAKKGLSAADKIFPGEPLYPIRHESQTDGHIKQLAEARKSSILSDATVFKGISQNPGVAVGGHISPHAINKVLKQTIKAFIGRFRVISVTHKLDANKNYFNEFSAIPYSVTAPPINRHIRQVRAESQVGIVVDNNDPEKLGRVRVQLKWQEAEGTMTPWIRINTNHASGDRGVYFVPEIDDEVDVDFIHGNPDAPYMQAAHYHGKEKPEWADPDNNFKAIKTRSGHTILLDDTDGEESITVLDKSGNTIYMDTKRKSITITAPETMTLECKNMNIKVGKNMSVNVGQDQTTSIKANRSVKVGKSSSLSAQYVSESAGKNMDISVDKDFSISSNQTKVTTTKKVQLNAEEIEMVAKKLLELMGNKEIKQNGGKVSLNAKGKMTVKGGATTYVQGSQVKIQG